MTRKTTDTTRSAPPLKTSGGKTAAPVDPKASSPNTTRRAAKGTPQRLTTQLLDTLCADFEAHGADAVRCCREEQPQGYLRLIAGLLPKEIELNDNRLKDIADDELDVVIGILRERVAASEGAR